MVAQSTWDASLSAVDSTLEGAVEAAPPTCILCGLPAQRHINAPFATVGTAEGEEQHFCCYACRYIYQMVAPDVAQGVALPLAISRAGLDLNAPCCRGIIQGDPAEVARNTLSRLMLNAFLTMMVMVLSLALYSDFFFADWGIAGQGVRSLFQLLALLFATPAILMLALPILESALFTWETRRRLTTDALIAVGSLAAYLLSVYAIFTGQGHTYFETASMTLLLVTLGRWLDARTQVEGSRALDALLARTPAEASLISPDGEENATPVANLRVGDHIRVRPGENLAVDGRIVTGQGSLNEANITGESAPVYKFIGDMVYAGTTNLDGSLVVEATEVGEERVMGKLVRLLDEARLHRAPIERLADRVAAYFVPVVITLALGTFGFWAWQIDFVHGLLNGLAVLLIACPCALGIATPLAIWAALGRAAQAGVLIRDSLTLEKLSQVKTVFFDKTGTLTTGQPALSEIAAADPAYVLQLAASLEHHATHPLAAPIVAAATGQNLPLLPVTNFQATPGLGIWGEVAGQRVVVGSRRLIEETEGYQLRLSPTLQAAQDRFERAGLTLVYVGWAGTVQGLLGLSDTVRTEAAGVLNRLQRRGMAVQVLTGDNPAAATAFGRQLGVTVRSRLLPHDKVRLIEEAEARTVVAMVGDGLNDAPALSRAGVGLALGCGADVTREAADVSLLGSDLNQIDWTLQLARRTYRTIGWNLGWAFAYNVIGVGLAMAGYLHPVLAAAAMVLSSALVVANSLRIR